MKDKVIIRKIFNQEDIKENFSKRDVLVYYTDGRYDHQFIVQFSNMRMQQVDKIHVGDTVELDYDIDSRESADGTRFFTTINGFSMKVVESAYTGQYPGQMPPNQGFYQGQGGFVPQQSSAPAQQAPMPGSAPQGIGSPLPNVDDDQLPF